MICTKNQFVALYYAEEPRQDKNSQHKIVCIDLAKVEQSKVNDISNGQGLAREAYELVTKQ